MKHTINVTENALRKLRESSGINRNTAVELAERAYKNGIGYNETKGSLHRYLRSVTSNSKKRNNY